jgi:hypothetical protein
MAVPDGTQLFSFPEHATITDLLLDWNPSHLSDDTPAIVDGISGKVTYTYASFRTGVKKLADYLRRCLQIRPGYTACLLLRNSVRGYLRRKRQCQQN